MNILFICTGNTCRSPMAEALVKEFIPTVNVQSAGVFASINSPANDNALKALREQAITLAHRSQLVTTELLEWADIVLTMTTQHKQTLAYQHPDFTDKYFTLKEYIAEIDSNVWEQLKAAYAIIERKRLQFIQEKEKDLSEEELEEALFNFLRSDIEHIRQLEDQLGSFDIMDPFGGDITVYRETYKELVENIKVLKRKISMGE